MDKIDIDPDTLELVRDLYAAELTFADRWIGKLLNKLDDLGLADNTVVYYLSDHGVTLGEHGIIGKSTPRPYPEIHHVPYMIQRPRRDASPGRRATTSPPRTTSPARSSPTSACARRG